jgi:hypothetical protein
LRLHPKPLSLHSIKSHSGFSRTSLIHTERLQVAWTGRGFNCIHSPPPHAIHSLSAPTIHQVYHSGKRPRPLAGGSSKLTPAQLSRLRRSLETFEEDWNAPGMDAYDAL